MRKTVSILLITVTATILLFSCGQTDNKQKEQTLNLDEVPRAEQIKISDLKSVLIRLQNKKLEFDFFGIHLNGFDCIYFMPDRNLYNIDFEAMYEEQLPWIDKLRQFADQNGYKTQMTTYGNKPHYKTSDTAPVLRIETKSDLDQTTTIGHNIMRQVFGNNDQIVYEVVP
ncbi:MAG: hypothetical protein ACT4OJ_09445 [Bacteroidota bacterium]